MQILGIGTSVPDNTMSQTEAAAMSDELVCRSQRESRLSRMLYRKAGIKNRHTCVPYRTAYEYASAAVHDAPDNGSPDNGSTAVMSTGERMRLYAEHSSPLAEAASRQAIESSGCRREQITHLITVSCTGFVAPGVDVALINQIGLPRSAQRLHIGYMGCHGAINALRAAEGLCAANPSARVLLCAVELCSLHYRFDWDDERVVGNALFADGAASLVLGQSNPAPGSWSVAGTGSYVFPQTESAITWSIGDQGFEMSLSPQLPELIRSRLRPWVASWLDQYGQSVESIESWAVHPGGPRVLNAVEESLGLTAEATLASREILERFGNMSSPTVLFIIDQLCRRQAGLPGVALGFGPGLAVEGALFH